MLIIVKKNINGAKTQRVVREGYPKRNEIKIIILQHSYCAFVCALGVCGIELESLADHAIALGLVAVGVGIHSGAAAVEFLVGDFKIDTAGENVKFDDVAVLDECKSTVRSSLGANVSYRQTRCAAGETSVGDEGAFVAQMF